MPDLAPLNKCGFYPPATGLLQGWQVKGSPNCFKVTNVKTAALPSFSHAAYHSIFAQHSIPGIL